MQSYFAHVCPPSFWPHFEDVGLGNEAGEGERGSLSIGTEELCVTPNGDGIGFRPIIGEPGEAGGRFGEHSCTYCGNLHF